MTMVTIVNCVDDKNSTHQFVMGKKLKTVMVNMSEDNMLLLMMLRIAYPDRRIAR